MKLQGCKTEFGNASQFIGYLMRTGETGLLCVSEIMRDEIFQEGLGRLQQQQKADFLSQFGSKLDWWRHRELTEKDSPKVHANRARILARASMVEDGGPQRKIHRTPEHTNVQEIVHTVSLTQKFHQTVGGSSGKEFIEPLPKSLLTDSDGAEKIKAAVLAVRDCFPSTLPIVLTVHFDKSGQNPHIQGWLSEKTWNNEAGCWGKPHELLDTSAGLQKLWVDVAQAVKDATGTSFNRNNTDDPLRPKRTVFHPRTSYWVQQYQHADLIKGDFLRLEQNPKAREATRQLIEQVRYDRNKLIQVKSVARFDEVIMTAEETNGLFRAQSGITTKNTSAPSATSSAKDIADAIAKVTASVPSTTSSANEIAAAMKHHEYFNQKAKSPRV
jgi:hypothetical protein